MHESLQDIIQKFPGICVLFTRRSDNDEKVRKHLSIIIIVPVSPTESNIRIYLGIRLDRDIEPNIIIDELWKNIMRIILKVISEV